MFAQQKCIVKDAKGNTLLEAPKFHGLYHLDCDNEEITACPTLLAAEIHRRLSHISQKFMKQLLDQQMISSLEVSLSDSTFTCDAWIQAKIAQVPLSKESREHAKKMGDRIYSDI